MQPPGYALICNLEVSHFNPIVIMAKTLKFEWFFPQEQDVVWECLTTPELVGEWLMPNDFQPIVGHEFEFRSKPQPGWSGIVYCEVREVTPMSRLAYTWTSGKSRNDLDMSTTVTWTLAPQANGTKLILEHAGFKGLKNLMVSKVLAGGWRTKIADRLKATIEAQATKRATSIKS
jgi:uncharacterized protein YndB with AHSA1/START domain